MSQKCNFKIDKFRQMLIQQILFACIRFKQPKNRVKNLDTFLSESLKTLLAFFRNPLKQLFEYVSLLQAKIAEKGEILILRMLNNF